MPPRNTRRPNHIHRRILSEIEKNGQKTVRGQPAPSLILVYVFLILILIGALLLSLPVATSSNKSAPFIDALFTATSAASTTGMIVTDTRTYWSTFGQQLILGLIQIGGLASLIISSILLLRIARRVRGKERYLLKESMHVSSGKGIAGLAIGVLWYVIIIEAAGVWLLYRHFLASQTQPVSMWLAIFHSISAFNNAGFEIMGLANYKSDILVNIVLSGMSIVGSLSFLIVLELLHIRSFSRLSLDGKLVLTASFWLLAMGTLIILLGEFTNPESLGSLPFGQKLLAAFFHSANARTSGLSTLDLGNFIAPTLLAITALMFIGGASGSSAGGIKVNTFGLLVASTRSAILGKREVDLLGGQAHVEQVNRAVAIAFLSIVVISFITFMLTITDNFPLLNIVFEVISAFSTTGYSTGITPHLSMTGKLLLVFAMFAGKVGPLTLAFALAHRHSLDRYSYAHEVINLG